MVDSLRSGAAVLMVATFENFLTELTYECIEKLAEKEDQIDFDLLGDGLRVANVYGALDQAMHGPRFEEQAVRKIDRLPSIEAVARSVAGKQLNPEAFGATRGNPNHETVKQIFKNVGYREIFPSLKERFETKWGGPISNDFVAQKLNGIVRRRHAIAHGDNALVVARSDLRESIKFLRILGIVLDLEMRSHFRNLMRVARK